MSSPWSCGADLNSIWNSNSPNLNLLRRYSLRLPASTNANANAHQNASPSQQQRANTLVGAHNATGHGLSACASSAVGGGSLLGGGGGGAAATATKSSCSWEPSADNKYMIGYIVISKHDLDVYHSSGLGVQVRGDKPTADGQFGAIVEHVVPGSLMNIVCKLKVGDEIVEWNGHSLRNRSAEEVRHLIESSGVGGLATMARGLGSCFGGGANCAVAATGFGCSSIIGSLPVGAQLEQAPSSQQLRLVAVRSVNNNSGGANSNNNSTSTTTANNNNNNSNNNNNNNNSNIGNNNNTTGVVAGPN